MSTAIEVQSALVNKLIADLNTIEVYSNVNEPEATLPAITIDLDGSFRNRYYGSDGYKNALIESDYEISVWGKTAKSAFDLGALAIGSLENYSGPLLGYDSPQTTFSIADIEIIGENTDFDARTKLYQYSINITVTHT